MRLWPLLLAGCAAGPSAGAGGDALLGPHLAAPPAAPEPAAASEAAGPWSRRKLAAAVARRHPSLRAMAHRVRARAAEARAAEGLPPPMAMAQLWQAPLHAPFVFGEGSMLMVGLQQTFPPGGARRAEARGALEEARVMAAELAAQERELGAQAALALADLREATALLGLHATHRGLLSQLGAAVRARLTTGASALGEQTRADRELAQQLLEEEQARGDERRARSELNALLGRPVDGAAEPLEDEPALPPSPGLDELLAQARERSPELLAASALAQREVARAEAADASARSPMYTVGVLYGLSRPGGMADTWGATFSMSLPWLSGALGAGQKARAEERSAARLDVEALRLRVERSVASAHARSMAAARRLALVEGRLLPATTRSLEAARAGFATGSTDALAWVEALHELREVELTRVRARGDLERALAELERAVGAEVPRGPLPQDGGAHEH